MGGERAHKLMTVEEFLAWDDGTDTRYELVDGVPWAMTPAGPDHMRISGNVYGLIEAATAARRPCRAIPQGGVAVAGDSAEQVYIPDVLMTCEPIRAQGPFAEPRLIVEVLSPSTQTYDKTAKLPRYASLASVEEIWLIASRARSLFLWERIDGKWNGPPLPLIGRATFFSRVLGVQVTLDAIYALTTLDADSSEDGPQDPRT